MEITLLRLPSTALAVTLALVQLVACGSSGTVDNPGNTRVCGTVKLDGGGGVAVPPKGAELCAGGLCNYQTQEGCAETESCRPLFPAGATTVKVGCEAAGEGVAGDSCKASTDCARGLLCVGESADEMKC